MKFSHTRYRVLGPELIPVYRQSARRYFISHSPAVGCQYFPPGLRSPSQQKNSPSFDQYQVILFGDRKTEAHRCEQQYAQSCYTDGHFETRIHNLIIASPTLIVWCYDFIYSYCSCSTFSLYCQQCNPALWLPERIKFFSLSLRFLILWCWRSFQSDWNREPDKQPHLHAWVSSQWSSIAFSV